MFKKREESRKSEGGFMGKSGTLIGVVVIVAALFGVGYLIFFGGAPRKNPQESQAGTKLAAAPGEKGTSPAAPGRESGTAERRTEPAAEESPPAPAASGPGSALTSANETPPPSEPPNAPRAASPEGSPPASEISSESSPGKKAAAGALGAGAAAGTGTAAALSARPKGTPGPAGTGSTPAEPGKEAPRTVQQSGTSTDSNVALAPGTAKLAEASPRYSTYVVKNGDTCWSIAVLLLGDGKRWKEIRDLNPGISEDGTGLNPGEGIKVPVPEEENEPTEESEPTVSSQTAPLGASYTIKEGDTLEGIAKRFYGDGSVKTWKEILAANPGLDPDILPAGKTIRLPEINGKKPAAPVPEAKPTGEEAPRSGTQVRSP